MDTLCALPTQVAKFMSAPDGPHVGPWILLSGALCEQKPPAIDGFQSSKASKIRDVDICFLFVVSLNKPMDKQWSDR